VNGPASFLPLPVGSGGSPDDLKIGIGLMSAAVLNTRGSVARYAKRLSKLQYRGHRVALVARPDGRAKARQAGLGFVAIGETPDGWIGAVASSTPPDTDL